VDVLNPDPGSIRLIDIATSLSRLARFNGHTLRPWSVAAHSLLAVRLAGPDAPPDLKLAILLHDAHEMVTGDIVTPVKRALRLLNGAAAVARIQQRVQTAIHRAAGLPEPGEVFLAAIKECDRMALAHEKARLMAPEPRPWDGTPDASGEAVAYDFYAPMFVWRDNFVSTAGYYIREANLTPMPDFFRQL
jgi:hypothetical protein